MTDITIPDAAVEAAAQVYFGEYGPSISWHSPSMSEDERDTWRDEVAVYLLAAAPYIAAQALKDMGEWFDRAAQLGTGERDAIAAQACYDRADRIEADHG